MRANVQDTLPPSAPTQLGFPMSGHVFPLKCRRVPRHKDRTDQHSKMTVTSVPTGRVLSLDLLQRGERQTPPELEASCPRGVTDIERWAACQRSRSGRRGRRARPRGRREAGSRAHACFLTQEGCGTHSPHSLHRRGAPTTETHQHAGTRPADQESTRECPKSTVSSVWLFGKRMPAGNAITQREQGLWEEAPRLRHCSEGSQARQTAGCTPLSGNKAALWARGRHTSHSAQSLRQNLPGAQFKGQERRASSQPAGPNPGALPASTAPPRQVRRRGWPRRDSASPAPGVD